MAMDASSPNINNHDDYSPSLTVINFDRPIPLLRGPLPASPSDGPSAGPYVLAFRNTQAWASAYRGCECKIIHQCEEGARIGCAISASSKCKPPWWKALMGAKASYLKERELCEVREMQNCFAAAREKCIGFARDKCLIPFRDARIAIKESSLNSKEAVKLIQWASMPERGLWVMGEMSSRCLSPGKFRVANCRASELLGSDESVQCIIGEHQHGVKN